MKSRFFSFLMIMVHVMSVNCRNLAPNNAKFTAISPRQANSPLLDQLAMDVEQGVREAENKIGSNPPSCEQKCYGCIPCDATQVPAISGYVGVVVQYSNYEPEDWKCKCGKTIYSP